MDRATQIAAYLTNAMVDGGFRIKTEEGGEVGCETIVVQDLMSNPPTDHTLRLIGKDIENIIAVKEV